MNSGPKYAKVLLWEISLLPAAKVRVIFLCNKAVFSLFKVLALYLAICTREDIAQIPMSLYKHLPLLNRP